MKTSPAPWTLEPRWRLGWYRSIIAGDGKPVVDLMQLHPEFNRDEKRYEARNPNSEADVRLLAAAPELLEALIGCVELLDAVGITEGEALGEMPEPTIDRARCLLERLVNP